MPYGMDGAQRAVSAAANQNGTGPALYRGRNTPPTFWLGDRDFSIVRFIATGNPDDRNFGAAEVLVGNDARGGWDVAPGAFDDEDGRYHGAVPNGMKPAMRFGIYMWVLASYRFNRPTDQSGQIRDYAKNWTQVPIPQPLTSLVQQFDQYNRDPETGMRWVADGGGFKIWFRGMGFNNSVINSVNRVKSFMRGSNLSSENLIIARKPSPPGRQIPAPEYIIERIPEDFKAMIDVPLNDSIKADIQRYYAALPPIKEYFEGRFKWPLFDEETQSVPVPVQSYQAAGIAAAPAATTPISEFDEVDTPIGTVVTAPPPRSAEVPAEFEGADLEEFRL